MTASATTNENTNTQTVFIKMALSAWDTYNSRVNKLVATLSDEEWLAETALGRNTGIYLLGHLIAVSDGLLPILGLGERLYPELDKTFLESPDKAGLLMPSLVELKEYWNKVNAKLSEEISRMPAEKWFNRHNNVSETDFAKEPHRNKLNIIINRTSHTSYHLGQLVYLLKK